MSKAFTRENDDEIEPEQPERIVSTYPNLVTLEGLAAIDAEIDRLSRDQSVAAEADDKVALSRAARDLRYWTARRNTAQVAPHPLDSGQVRFGSTVTIEREDGRRSRWRIVGEDEADPAGGTLSHAAPVARALMGREVGDTVEAGASDAEIVEISV